MKGKLIGWAVFLMAAIALVVLAGHPSPLPTSNGAHPGTSLADFNTGSYSSCANHSAPCLAYLNTGNYPTTATAFSQECNTGEFDGPGSTNSNLDGNGKTIDDGWLFVARANVNYYDIKVTFKDTSNVTHTVTFPGTASPPQEPANAANIYFTKNYSHIAVLTPPGWTLTGATGLMAGNHASIFELSHTCGSQTGGGGGHCNYPPNNSVIQASKAAGRSGKYNVSGTLTENTCPEPCQTVKLTGKTGSGYSTTTTTDNNGRFTFTNVPGSDFPVTLSFAGNGTWPPANSVVVS